MASTIMHLAITSLVARQLEISDRNLLLGGVLPDFSEAFNSHYRVENPKTKEKTIDLFKICEELFSNAENVDMTVIGFYLHLVQDRFFCQFLIENCGIGICTENTKRLYHDYSLLNSYIIDHYALPSLLDIKFPAEDSFLNQKFRLNEAAFRKSIQDSFKTPPPNGTAILLTKEMADQFIEMAAVVSLREFDAVQRGCPPYDKVPYYWIRQDKAST